MMQKVFSFANTNEAAAYMDEKMLRYIDEQMTDSFEYFKIIRNLFNLSIYAKISKNPCKIREKQRFCWLL